MPKALRGHICLTLSGLIPRFGRIESFAQGILVLKSEVFRGFGARSQGPQETKPHRIPLDEQDALDVLRAHQNPGDLGITP